MCFVACAFALMVSQQQNPESAQPPVIVPAPAAKIVETPTKRASPPGPPGAKRNWNIEMLIHPAWREHEAAKRRLGNSFLQDEIEAMTRGPVPIAQWIKYGCERFHATLMGKTAAAGLDLHSVVSAAAAGEKRNVRVLILTYDPTFSTVRDGAAVTLSVRIEVRLYAVKVEETRITDCELLFEDRSEGRAGYTRPQMGLAAVLELAVTEGVTSALAGSNLALLGGDVERRIGKVGAVILCHPQLNETLERVQVLVGKSSSSSVGTTETR